MTELINVTDPINTYYHKIVRMSNSMMKHFRQSPRHYLYELNNKSEPTAAMIFGSAFHHYVLENDSFDSNYCTLPDDAPSKACLNHRFAKKPSEATIANISWWDAFNERNGTKIQLKAEDLNTIDAMANALYADDLSRELLAVQGENEKAFLWTDPETGIEMKAKMDKVTSEFTLDIKTCMNAHPKVFGYHAFDMDYHNQAALYKDARGICGMNKGSFYFIAIEKEAPYGISVMKCSKDFIIAGRMQYTETLEAFAYWKEMGSPNVGYEWRSPLGFHVLNLPSWATR